MRNGHRAELLAAVRAALGRRTDFLPPRKREPLPTDTLEKLAERFGMEWTSAGGQFIEVCSIREMHAYLEQLITLRSVRLVAVSNAPLFRSLPLVEWLADRVESLITIGERGTHMAGTATAEQARADMGISSCTFAIARSGTLLISAGIEKNRLISLLPMTYVAVFTPAQLILDLGTALRHLQACEDLNRSVILITGPSRTGDIEMTLTAGVHGPGDVHAMLLNLNDQSEYVRQG